MARIAIVTGAAGGIGSKFIEKISVMDDIDEIWAVGRNPEKLEALKTISSRIVPVIMDLSSVSCRVLSDMLKEKKPDVRILVNNAGTGYMGAFDKMSPEQVVQICNINCTAPAAIMSEVLPYMTKGARILNISSASSFQPDPYLAMYSASKVFLKNLSRAVNNELKARGITVTSKGRKINYIGMLKPEKVVSRALKDSAKGKDMSVPGWFAKYFRFYSKITPTGIVMRQWAAIMGKYV